MHYFFSLPYYSAVYLVTIIQCIYINIVLRIGIHDIISYNIQATFDKYFKDNIKRVHQRLLCDNT